MHFMTLLLWHYLLPIKHNCTSHWNRHIKTCCCCTLCLTKYEQLFSLYANAKNLSDIWWLKGYSQGWEDKNVPSFMWKSFMYFVVCFLCCWIVMMEEILLLYKCTLCSFWPIVAVFFEWLQILFVLWTHAVTFFTIFPSYVPTLAMKKTAS